MRREQKGILVVVVIMMFIVTSVFLPGMSNAGNLEPPGPPGSTMKTLDEIPPTWSQKITDSSKRFELVLDGAGVLDKETGLVWEKSPDTTQRTLADACSYCSDKEVGGRKGWRLPAKEELASLVDMSVGAAPYLPAGHPFSNVQPFYYWSSTTNVTNTSYAWSVYFSNGDVTYHSKSNGDYVWCVRGGQGHDAY